MGKAQETAKEEAKNTTKEQKMQWKRHKKWQKRKQKHNKRAESVMWKKQEIEKTDGRIYDSGKG